MRQPALLRAGGMALLLLCGFYVFLTLRGPHGIPAVLDKRHEIRELQERNADLVRENQLRRERIQRLAHSPTEQELEIRKRLKLARPGDTVFMLPERAKTEPAR
jgi:cell division protein FtsB